MFNTSDTRLRKKMLVENRDLKGIVKLGPAHQHTTNKSDQMGDRKVDDASVRLIIKEEVNKLSLAM